MVVRAAARPAVAVRVDTGFLTTVSTGEQARAVGRSAATTGSAAGGRGRCDESEEEGLEHHHCAARASGVDEREPDVVGIRLRLSGMRARGARLRSDAQRRGRVCVGSVASVINWMRRCLGIF